MLAADHFAGDAHDLHRRGVGKEAVERSRIRQAGPSRLLREGSGRDWRVFRCGAEHDGQLSTKSRTVFYIRR